MSSSSNSRTRARSACYISFGNGEASERLNPGDTETIEVGVVGEDMEFWCSVSNHREMGMEGMIVVTD